MALLNKVFKAMKFNTTEEIIADLALGKMVIVVDDEDRENEGDFLMASSQVKPEDINFMATHGRGLICMTLTAQRCKQLDLSLMVQGTNHDIHGTNFTVSIEAAQGVTTGISAQDRALTIQAAVAKNATGDDIVQPGHIFPLKAQLGGVLTRAGHTEAGCDLAGLAGFEPSATIVEILNEDGTMARRDDLFKIAEQHHLKIGTIEDLISYRIANEKTIERIQEVEVNTEFGKFKLIAYQEPTKHNTHLALVKGEISSDTPVMVRVHLENELCDMLSLTERACGWPLRSVMQRIQAEGHGIIVILRDFIDTQDLLNRIKTIEADTHKPEAEQEVSSSQKDLRTFGIGAQILKDIGVTKMRVMSAPMKFHAIGGFGLEIIDYVQD